MGFDMAAEKSVSLTTDVLDRVDIGLWAVEIDEGRAPRMYANKTMLKLLGLGEGVSAEDVFHAWFDNIDPEHFEEVKAYVDKMSAGGKAEIQYPWHSPDGRVRFVRCGGTRDYEYKDGVRLKGWHRDITELVLIQKTAEEELRKEIKTMGLDAKRESLQSALNEKLYGKAILDYSLEKAAEMAMAYEPDGLPLCGTRWCRFPLWRSFPAAGHRANRYVPGMSECAAPVPECHMQHQLQPA